MRFGRKKDPVIAQLEADINDKDIGAAYRYLLSFVAGQPVDLGVVIQALALVAVADRMHALDEYEG